MVLLAALGLAAIGLILCLPPIRQKADYHDFADARPFCGIPSALNVLSNLPFLVVGVLGLNLIARPSASFREGWERGPAAVLLVAFLLVTFGSGFYHWNPNDRTLFWDRLPLALVFSSFLGVTLIERVSLRGGALLFVPLVAAGLGSVLYWARVGDLRFYILVQAGSILAIPAMIFLFPPRYTGDRTLLLVVALYGLAKAFEILDGPVYGLGHLLSGHTLKHLVGGLAAWAYVRHLQRRRPARAPQSLVAPAPQA
jgi:hypothetical protein